MRPNLEKNHGGRDRLIKRVEVKSFSYDPEDAANIPLAASDFLYTLLPPLLVELPKLSVSPGLVIPPPHCKLASLQSNRHVQAAAAIKN